MSAIYEILWVVPYFVLFFSSAKSKGFRPLGYLQSWGALIILSGVFRGITEVTPLYSAPFCQALLLLTTLFNLKKLLRKPFRIRPSSLPLMLLYGVILVRNAFPQIDIDSLTYHLAGVRWILEHKTLSPFMQIADGQGVQLRLLGFEEFLLFPGTRLDLALFAGLLGGCLKVFAISTVVSLVPVRFWSLRYAAAALMVADDHFLFSGQNDSVYFNISFLALIPLTVYFCAQFIFRPTQRRFGHTVLGFMLLGFVKYHGVIMGAAMGFILIPGLLLQWKSWIRPQKIERTLLFQLAGATLALISMYGIHWWQEGSPFYPSTVGGLFTISSPFRDLTIYSQYFLGGTYLEAFGNLFRLLIYPGNWVLKGTAVLIAPTLIGIIGIFCIPQTRKKIFQSPRIRFFLLLSVLGLAFTIFWVTTAHVIRPRESRYPRFTFTVALLAWFWLLDWASTLFFHSRIFRAAQKKLSPVLYAGAALAILFLIWTWDTRQFNTMREQRQKWADWKGFWQDRFQDPTRDSLTWPSVLRPLHRHEKDQLTLLNDCMKSLGDFSGDQTLFYSVMGVWSSYNCIPHAIRGDIMAGGLLRNIPAEHPQWIVVPRSWNNPSEITPVLTESPLNMNWIQIGLSPKNRVCETAFYWVAKNPLHAK